MDALRHSEREDGANQRTTAKLLHKFCQENQDAFGLTADAKTAVRSFHHAVRLLGAELEEAQDLVCEVVQTKDVPLFPGAKSNTRVCGGTTLVIRNDGRVRYAIAKELHSRRQQDQIDYATGHVVSSASLYCRDTGPVELRALHRGY